MTTTRAFTIAALGAALPLALTAAPATATPVSMAGAVTAAQDEKPSSTDVDVPFGPRIRLADLNGDKRADVVLFDWQKDGTWDGGLIDRDRDGTFDFRWTDANGDGKPQKGELTPIPTIDDTWVRLGAAPGCLVSVRVPRMSDTGCHWPVKGRAAPRRFRVVCAGSGCRATATRRCGRAYLTPRLSGRLISLSQTPPPAAPVPIEIVPLTLVGTLGHSRGTCW